MPVSKKQQACVNRYNAKNYDRINYMTPKGGRDILKQAASLHGVSTNAYITAALEKALAEDGLSLPPAKTDLEAGTSASPES